MERFVWHSRPRLCKSRTLAPIPAQAGGACATQHSEPKGPHIPLPLIHSPTLPPFSPHGFSGQGSLPAMMRSKRLLSSASDRPPLSFVSQPL